MKKIYSLICSLLLIGSTMMNAAQFTVNGFKYDTSVSCGTRNNVKVIGASSGATTLNLDGKVYILRGDRLFDLNGTQIR